MDSTSTKENLQQLIHVIRDKRVILDQDLARVLGMETRILNQIIKRHTKVFLYEDYFRLVENENEILKFQNSDFEITKITLRSQNGSSKKRGGRVHYLPFAFTHSGVNKLCKLTRKAETISLLKTIINLLTEESKMPINPSEGLHRFIYEIRGKHVMLDFDLAVLYECQNGAKTVNLAVKRNAERFPKRFVFQITEQEFANLRFRFETTKSKTRSLPHAFTEEGVAMLATVLRTKIASRVSVKIMDAFVLMKKYFDNKTIMSSNINDMIIRHDNEIKLLQESFAKFASKKVATEIYFNGQIYDAYSKILDIFNEAKRSLIIIDNYADKVVLDMIKKLECNITIITKYMSKVVIQKYLEQYSNLKVVFDNSFHDRFFIIDNHIVYHCGTSLNKIGHKTFAINILGEDEIAKSLISKVEKIIR